MSTTVSLLDRRILSLSEACDLGYGAVSTLRRDIREGRLQAYRIGRRVVLRVEDLEDRLVPILGVGHDDI